MAVFVLTLVCLIATSAQAQTFTVIHSFTGAEGAVPESALTLDRAGNFYGAASAGGNSNHGTIFKLSRAGSGWIYSTLYKFRGGDGSVPMAPPTFGPDGALYGTTQNGGVLDSGTVFRLRPPSTICRSVSCPWSESVLFSFGGQTGTFLSSGVIFDPAGNIYGTASGGGSLLCDCGLVYQLSNSNGHWHETVLHDFTYGADGRFPGGGLALDASGTLYGTVVETDAGPGAVYTLSPSGSGWTLNVIHQFEDFQDGGGVYAGVIFDSSGNLYGDTYSGGSDQGGTVFELARAGSGWDFHLLYSLPMGASSGGPLASLLMDNAGDLYGTTNREGAFGWGTVFKLTRTSGGYVYSSLHDFTGGDDGMLPSGSLVIDANGNLYGTAAAGGIFDPPCNDYGGCGIVFEITAN